MPKRSIMYLAGIIALVGGTLIVFSGYRSQGMLLTVIRLADEKFGSSLPTMLQIGTNFTIDVLTAIIALGGLLVIAGGFVLLFNHSLTGRLMIALGGGFGFLGILIAVGLAYYETGIGGILSHLDYFVGIVLASIARYISKRA